MWEKDEDHPISTEETNRCVVALANLAEEKSFYDGAEVRLDLSRLRRQGLSGGWKRRFSRGQILLRLLKGDFIDELKMHARDAVGEG